MLIATGVGGTGWNLLGVEQRGLDCLDGPLFGLFGGALPASVLLGHGLDLAADTQLRPKLRQSGSGGLYRVGMVDDGGGITAGAFPQFRNPAVDEDALRVMVQQLLGWAVNADRIDAGGA